ncbi:hypothetical protein ACLD39_22715 [Salmonella sp. 741265081_PST]|uniref:hypothetical protein n=1 Tax=Salmonella TaxID=590 RepID=UPI0012847673|nr:hypothetical protein [Salmonella enterica]ECO6367388.1 hypothetical protein [Salmonella enterica subsp. enterica]HBM0082480.1 hypothetical protein [Salmonella enterica subsp. enterica serovar Brikama]
MMEELAKTVQQKYIDEIVSKYPLHRFVILFVFIISTYAYNVTEHSLLTELRSVKVGDLFDFKDGLISKVTLLQLIFCVALTAINTIVFEKTSGIIFNKLIKRYDIAKFTQDLKTRYEKIRTNNELVNYYLSKDITFDLDKKKIRLRCLTINIEYLTAIVFSIVIGVMKNGVLELLGFIVVLSLLAFLHFRLFIFYIQSFIPLHVAEKVLQGADVDIENPLS